MRLFPKRICGSGEKRDMAAAGGKDTDFCGFWGRMRSSRCRGLRYVVEVIGVIVADVQYDYSMSPWGRMRVC